MTGMPFPWRKLERMVFKIQKLIHRAAQTGRAQKRDRKTEEPDEVKVSRPVLKTSRTGNSLA